MHVKKNTLMVLTHLILNGMIKVKGQLGEMAKCIEDPDQRISDLARLFFKELSTKENALYNNLQDVISHLSIGVHAVDEETFEKTMRYIFTFIEKVSRFFSLSALRSCATTSLTLPTMTCDLTGEASRGHHREALPAVPARDGRTAVERHCVLPVAPAVQV